MANKPMSDDIISEMTKKMLSYFKSKDTNKKNAKKRVTKAQKEALSGAGGFTKLQLSRQADAKRKKRLAKQQKNVKGQGQSGGINITRVRTGAKTSGINLTKNEGKVIKSKDNLSDRRIALAARKEKAAIDKAYKRNVKSKAALSEIKKDANIKTDKTPKKKVIVTKEQLRKSGLSLRDYMNFMQGKTRRDDKKSPPKKSSSKVMVDSFKKSNVSVNKNKKAGVDEAKGDNKKVKNYKKNTNKKLDSKGNYKGTNIKPTKLQLERMKKRRARGAVT